MRISGIQLFWILFTFNTGNMLLITVGPAILEAKQDAWISFIIATILGSIIVFVAAKVSLLYPKHSLIEFSQLILGKWLGSLIGIIYLVQWFTVIGNILIELGDFTITVLLSRTPNWALILTMLLLVVYGTYVGGIEGIGRCSEVFGPIIILMLVLIFIFIISDLDVRNILPVFSDSGLLPIMKGSLTPLSLLGESVVITMLISLMDEPKQGQGRALLALVMSSFLVSAATVCALMVFGPNVTAKMRFPAFDFIRYISIMDFIQNIEIIAVLVWILSVFIKLSVYFFSACYGTAQLLKVKEWRKLIWLVAVTSFILSQIGENPTITVSNYIHKYWIPYALPINMIGIPLLLWIVGSIRKRNGRKKSPDLSL